jgi:hypothetical protein
MGQRRPGNLSKKKSSSPQLTQQIKPFCGRVKSLISFQASCSSTETDLNRDQKAYQRGKSNYRC